MRTLTRILSVALAFFAALSTVTISEGAIESNFDDQVYPGAAGSGWVDGWQHTAIGTPPILPLILTTSPIQGTSPYLEFDATGSAVRNVMREYASGSGVDIAAPHTIRWKFRLNEDDFANAFTVFNDRVHFFARNAPRLTSGTDASISWSITAAGDAHTSGAMSGKTFWIFDNVDGASMVNLANHVDSLVPLVPGNVYAFEVLVDPGQMAYRVAISNETSGATFKSAAPHRFRNLSVSGTAHTYLHFGVQASAAAEPRAFDLDSVALAPWGGPALENVAPNAYAIHPATNGVQFNVVALEPIAAGGIGMVLNGVNVSSQLVVTGAETNRVVAYSALSANTVYEMTITATNAAGTASLTRTFYTATGPFVLYDSQGFTNDVLYPAGYLQAVTHGDATWVPSVEPAEVVDVGDGTHGKVLQRMNMGVSRVDYLQFRPVSSGTITIAFDAMVSTTTGRTIDIALMTASGAWASHVAWGALSGKLSYYELASADWLPVADLPSGWHHCEIIHYLSGAAAGRYDVLVDGVPVASKVLWRSAVPGAPLTQMSYQSHSSGPMTEYGRVDNLVVTAEPENPNAFPTPTISNISPARYAVARPTDSLQFEVTSVLPISGANLSVALDGSNVSSGLTVTGPADHLAVSYGPLSLGSHTVVIAATNGAGPAISTHEFYVTVDPLTIFDSGGFSDDTLYPIGYLMAVTNGGSRWVPAAAPNSAEIVDLADGLHGKVLRRQQLGADYTDYLLFPPVSSGVVEVVLDARMSSVGGRVLDLSLNSVTASGGGTQGPFLMWSTNALFYYNGSAWIEEAPMDLSWHRVQLNSFVSGPKAGTFDLLVDNTLAAEGLVWRNVFSPVGTLRIGAIRGLVSEYGDVDNLKINVRPEPHAALPVTLLKPVRTATTFSFSFQSLVGVRYQPQHTSTLGSGNWTNLDPITGDAAEKTVIHNNPPAGSLFYRVQSELP